jgi:hypothetical protein
MKTPSTDRRVYERFDVVGALWGVLELPEIATVVKLSSTGMLVQTAICPPLNSVQTLRVLVDGDPVLVDTVVRHCRPGPGGTMRLGLEFLTAPTMVLASIEQLSADKQIEVIDAEASRS